MKVSGIHSLGLRVPDLQAAHDFYLHNWGMGLAGSESDARYFQSKGCDHVDLTLRKGHDAVLDHVALAVRSEDDLHAALDALERAGHPVEQKRQRDPMPGEAFTTTIRDPDGNRVELVVPAKSSGTQPVTEGAAIGPRKLGHVVLWTPQLQKQEAFYSLLGFQVADRTHLGMSFLRCNTDHHSIAFAGSAHGRTGLQHAAFDVGSLDNVMREFGRLRTEGIACIWGVGRHGPGNNIFSYYQDPAGHVVEFYGDMETVPEADEIEPRFWGPEHKGDIWGVAGAPPEPFLD